MIVDKLHKRAIIRVQQPDSSPVHRTQRCVTDAIGDAMLITHLMLEKADLQPGDELTVDVRILIERK